MRGQCRCCFTALQSLLAIASPKERQCSQKQPSKSQVCAHVACDLSIQTCFDLPCSQLPDLIWSNSNCSKHEPKAPNEGHRHLKRCWRWQTSSKSQPRALHSVDAMSPDLSSKFANHRTQCSCQPSTEVNITRQKGGLHRLS